MAEPETVPKRFPLISVIAGVVILFSLLAAGIYLMRPSAPAQSSAASPEATAYLAHLALSDVVMEATENFMKQQVIEVRGSIQDNGLRSLSSVEVYCLFYGVDGHEIHRERLPIVNVKNVPLRPGEKRPFRLPFDSIPDGWNQSMPKLVIAQINFAQ